MRLLFDSLWRAAGYMFLPRVLGWTMVPLVVSMVVVAVLAWTIWPALLAALQSGLHQWWWTAPIVAWIESWLGLAMAAWVAPVVLLVLLAPMAALGIMLTVALHTTPRLVGLVAERRFTTLERRRGAGLWQSVAWSVGCTLAALFTLLISLPLWLLPVVGALIPPLIWGWFTAKVMIFDVLAEHASAPERRALLRQHAGPLLVMGVVSGYLGLLPSMLWTFSVLGVLLAPVLLGLAVWLYVVVFVLVALWFCHYGLAALQAARTAREGEVLPPDPVVAAARSADLPPRLGG